jgi:hypothetical protein
VATSPGAEVTASDQPPPEPEAPLAWDCQCGINRNSAMVAECPVCHTPRPFDYTPPTPTPLTLDERFDAELARRRAGGMGPVPTQTGRPPGHYVPVTLKSAAGQIDVDSLLLQSLLDVANKAASLGATVSVTAQLTGLATARLTLEVDYDFSAQPLPHGVSES